MNEKLHISSGPHVRSGWTTQKIMFTVVLALLPATVVGVIVHGWNALFIILASVAAAVLSEALFDLICRKPATWKDGSAVVTGLMLALTLSADTPAYIAAIGSVFAIIVVKCAFGGLGKNFINPALAARCFLLISFPGPMTKFLVDGVSAPTPVAELAAGRAVNITSMFLGTSNGIIGSSIVCLLIGGLFLWALDIIKGQIWISVLTGFILFLGIFGGQGFDPKFLAAHLCGGGVVLGAFFMATDYCTSPVSRLGHTIYGLMIGILGALFRVFGTAADSFSYSIIIANLFVPLIDHFIIPKPYAFRKHAEKVRSGETRKPLGERIPRPVIVLTATALIAGLALSGVFMLTKDRIAAEKEAKEMEAYQTVIPGAEKFEKLAAAEEFKGEVYGNSFGRVYINEAVAGRDASGSVIGYAVSATSAEAYNGNLTVSVGFKPDGSITMISLTEIQETPGKGMLAILPEFKDQFNGRNVSSFKLLKDGGGTQENEIDGVSGATITSKAVVNAVNAALDFYHNSIAGGGR